MDPTNPQLDGLVQPGVHPSDQCDSFAESVGNGVTTTAGVRVEFSSSEMDVEPAVAPSAVRTQIHSHRSVCRQMQRGTALRRHGRMLVARVPTWLTHRRRRCGVPDGRTVLPWHVGSANTGDAKATWRLGLWAPCSLSWCLPLPAGCGTSWLVFERS